MEKSTYFFFENFLCQNCNDSHVWRHLFCLEITFGIVFFTISDFNLYRMNTKGVDLRLEGFQSRPLSFTSLLGNILISLTNIVILFCWLPVPIFYCKDRMLEWWCVLFLWFYPYELYLWFHRLHGLPTRIDLKYEYRGYL